MDNFTLAASDGTDIPVYHWPVAQSHSVVLILHGMSEYATRYDAFARFLQQRGIAVLALDHRGHGRSPVLQGSFGQQNGWANVVQDVAAVRSKINDLYPRAQIYLLGHSMGSFIARAVFIQQGNLYSGLILSATGYRQSPIAKAMRWLVTTLGSDRMDKPSQFMAKLVFGSFNLNFFPARTKVDWLSRDRNTVDGYLADPMCGFAPVWRLWSDLFGGIIEIESDEAKGTRLPKHVPVLLMTGSRDPVGMGKLAPKQLAERYHAAGLSSITRQVWEGGRHEMLNETNRDEVMSFVAQWIANTQNTTATNA